MDDLQQPKKEQPKKSGFRKFLRRLILVIILIGVTGFWWKYYFTYSDGLQGGKMQKISKRGNIFKTWEGYLLISLNTESNNNLSLLTKEFAFSVTSDSIAHLLETYEGKRVKIRYKQKHGSLPWRGDSKYLVYQVTLDE